MSANQGGAEAPSATDLNSSTAADAARAEGVRVEAARQVGIDDLEAKLPSHAASFGGRQDAACSLKYRIRTFWILQYQANSLIWVCGVGLSLELNQTQKVIFSFWSEA
jgi:hypothetical protein